MNWDDLRFVLALHRHGSVAGAARALKVDPSTIGRRIAALEGELGAQLVQRQPEGMKLTEAGQEAAAAAEAMDARLTALEAKVGGAAEVPRGRVRVSATDGFTTLLYGGLAALREDYPEVLVDLTVSSSAVDLARGEADVAIRLFRETRGDLVARKVCDIGWSLFASPAYVARKGSPADPGDLAGHDVVGFAEALERAPGARWLAERGRGGAIVLRGSSTTALTYAVKAGMGLGVLPCFAADATLVRLTTAVLATSEVFLVTTADARSTARVRVVIDALAAMFARERVRLAG